MARLNWKRITQHVAFWIVYLLLNAGVVYILEKRTELFTTILFREAFFLPAKWVLTYFIFYYIIPLYLDRSKLVKLVSLTLVSFFAATVLYIAIAWGYFNLYENLDGTRDFLRGITNRLVLGIFDLYITATAAITIKMIRLRYKSQELEEQLIGEKLQSELNFLRAQTNPHFLFNTLNNLYVLARRKADQTPDAIMMLSKIMRFVLFDCRAARIPLDNEAKVIRDYIELEKLRYNQRLRVQYTELIEDSTAQIAPLLLLPLVENSFKHGASNITGDVEIDIQLILQGKNLVFTVSNPVETEKTKDPMGLESNGIGLDNVKRQLELIYPGQYDLSIEQTDGMFNVFLHLNLAV